MSDDKKVSIAGAAGGGISAARVAQSEDADNTILQAATFKQRRPKRKQVKRACTNCRKSHSGCDDLRPCSRCTDNGLEASCEDVPRKKRATRRKMPSDSTTDMGEIIAMTPTGLVFADRTGQNNRGRRLQSETDESSAMNNLLRSNRDDSSQSKASDIAATMNKANNYQSLVTELSDLRRYNTRLEHTLQNILVEVQQLRSRSDGKVKLEPNEQTSPAPSGVNELEGSTTPFNAFANEVPGIATWRVHDSTLLECNDRFMEIVQQPLDTLKNNFKCLQLFPQRLYEDFIHFKQSVLYGGGGNQSMETQLILPGGREKSVLMTLQALKHEENVSPQFMVMHIVELNEKPPGSLNNRDNPLSSSSSL